MSKLSPATKDALAKSGCLWAPPPREPPSKWIEREYVISAEESAEPGRYSFGRYAYLKDVIDWFDDPDVEMIVLPKAAQTGWTTVFTGLVGSKVANDPCRILVAMPTGDEAEIWSKDRLEPNLKATPSLRSKISPAKSRDGNNKILHKRFPGGALKVVGATSSTGISSWPAKFAFCDEVDRYPLSASGEAVVHGSGAWAQQPQPRPGSGDADVTRASQLQHAVEGMGGDRHLGRPTLVRARVRVFPDYRAIVDACCTAWSRLVAEPGRIRSLCNQPWITNVSS